ncbi:MAG TPA: TraB/GumN family protein [Sphingomicrobium sp.]|nr:TraB/GumN family protein [Sphingomicrobium sp.]
MAACALLALLAATGGSIQAAPMPPMPAQALVRATPALWEIRDADTTIYLFGTFHTLDGRTVWFGDKVRDAFDRSGELVLETIVPDPAAIQAARGRVTEIAPDGTAQLKPFVAQTQAVVNEGRTAGLSVENGADSVLRRVAENVGKPVGGLERFEDQLGTLASIPTPPAAVTRPSASAVSITVSDLLSAWTTGNTGAFSNMLAGFEAKSPVAYRMLIADRNARWGQWIANRLEKPGTVFVAVGTGHLAGKDSVQQWLAARGIASTRVV